PAVLGAALAPQPWLDAAGPIVWADFYCRTNAVSPRWIWVDRGTNRGRFSRGSNDGGQQAQHDLGIYRRQPVITLPIQKKQSLTGRPQVQVVSAADFVPGPGFGGGGCSELGRKRSRYCRLFR